MNPAMLLALITDLYTQLTTAQQRITELERELKERTPDPDNPPPHY